MGIVSGFSPLLCRERDEEAGFPQSHGEEKGLEDLGGGQLGERVGMGCPSPRDADDGTRALGGPALGWRKWRWSPWGRGRWMGVEVGLSYPKSMGLSGPDISACQQGLRADYSRSAQGATLKPTLRAAWLGKLH